MVNHMFDYIDLSRSFILGKINLFLIPPLDRIVYFQSIMYFFNCLRYRMFSNQDTLRKTNHQDFKGLIGSGLQLFCRNMKTYLMNSASVRRVAPGNAMSANKYYLFDHMFPPKQIYFHLNLRWEYIRKIVYTAINHTQSIRLWK